MASYSRVSAFHAAGADLLAGCVDFGSCGHIFSYISGHTLPRTSEGRACPRCEDDGKCVICLKPWDAKATESCPHCDMCFAHHLLEERIAKIEAGGLIVARDSLLFVVRRRMELERKEQRKERLLALKTSEDDDNLGQEELDAAGNTRQEK
ncbi:uncharacterized protein PG998_002436 [Apiospora kogelbergensis]|uniref:Uncharacterized protein n=1 Tax=Apiospora kogelbergensis TaxID=1337665 RepID=A0AAW0Q8D8_9PEZI